MMDETRDASQTKAVEVGDSVDPEANRVYHVISTENGRTSL